MNLHPESGRRYILIFPEGQFYQEIASWYRSASVRLPWMSVQDLSGWSLERPEWQDPETVLVFWGRFPASVPEPRRAGLVYRFSESVGQVEGLVAYQQELLREFTQIAIVPDLVLVGSPTVADFWKPFVRAVAVAPVGYEPACVGFPDWGVSKKFDLTFRGNQIGRRIPIFKQLRKSYRSMLLEFHAFGLDRKVKMDECRIDLYVGHSEEPSFPGSRLWATIASSAALVTEPRDAWPAVRGRHYIEIPSFDSDMPEFFIESLDALIAHPRILEGIARTAHNELSLYTIDRCMNEFVVPATKGFGR
jgi:hypothetical protein